MYWLKVSYIVLFGGARIDTHEIQIQLDGGGLKEYWELKQH